MKRAIISLLFVVLLMGATDSQNLATTSPATATAPPCLTDGLACTTNDECCNKICRNKFHFYFLSFSTMNIKHYLIINVLESGLIMIYNVLFLLSHYEESNTFYL